MTSASWPEAYPESAPASTFGVPGSPDALRHVMGHFASGVTIATALHRGIKHAMTATAVCAVSFDPPLVLVCVSKSSRFHRAITETENWCLSLLTVDQEQIAWHFSNRGRDLLSQFDDIPHNPSPLSGTPLIETRWPGRNARRTGCTMAAITRLWWVRLCAPAVCLLMTTQTLGLH